MRFLNLAFHYPKPEHADDLIAAMEELAAAAADVDGLLQMGAFIDEANERIVAVSVWASPAAFKAAGPVLAGVIAATPFDEWERRPREVYALPEVAAQAR